MVQSAIFSVFKCSEISKPSTLGSKEMVLFREVSGLERCTANIENRT